MRYIAVGTGVLAMGIAAFHFAPGVHASTGPIPLNCNRTCLEGLVDQYLAALVAHDPKRLPLSADVIYTENDQQMSVGDGFWKTVEGPGNYKHIFADPEFGQVAMMGTMREAGAAMLVSIRIRIELGRITEIESAYYRPGNGGPSGIPTLDKPGYKAEDLWFKSIPVAQRASRQELISVADAYFSGLQKNDGKGVNGTGTYLLRTIATALRMAHRPRMYRGRQTKHPTRSTALRSIAFRNSSWVITLLFRAFITGGIRW